ncbi:adenylate kinase isoenzyme 5 [Selaginella moellendorffii]|uniref:adenylate kinase isoenzyme 5 n=1 Tax=Selaginella moellendorffii TaxID=88036 RepID=UPI000D1C3D71|nr:adenylate kinase isoenzyme 5 [Selaginella moellendorffii]|eukprot:XP_024538873.1 adenylate kinase isoenzyme 5 [Selaginella moellendorffii]
MKRRVSQHGIPLGSRAPTRLTVFVLGGPGCGKGTQCEELVKNYGFVHLSAGELLRDEIKNKTQIGISCEELMAEGKLVPSEIPLNLLKAAMEKSERKHFLIDGFPRSVDQAQLFEKKIGKPNLVIYLECPFKVMQERLLKRGETSGRSDDNMETIKKRFETYRKESFPVVRFYEKVPNLLKTVSSAMSPTEVFEYIAQLLKDQYGLVAKFAPVLTGFDHRQHNCKRRTIIFVLGGPGCGKGTQCERMVRDFGYSHLSTGDLLRAEVASGSELGKQCDTLMKEGKLVPLDVTINLLKQAMGKAKCKRFLIDGFPRAVDQAHEFEAKVGKPDVVLCLDCSLELMEKRLLQRGKASGRADDNIETIKKRFETFLAESKPVIDYYRKSLPKAVKTIPTDKMPDEVYADVKAALKATAEKPVPPKVPAKADFR